MNGFVKRDIQSILEHFISGNVEQIVLLSGARQTGKTSIVRNLTCKEEKVIVNLWDEEREVIALRNARTFSEFELILKTVFNFIPLTGKLLIIDEAQASEYLSSFIMEMQRKWQGQKVILLGSLLANLYKKGQPMPVGRTVEFVCRPLNFNEYLRFKNKEQLFGLVGDEKNVSPDIHALFMDEYRSFLQIGGLPGVVATVENNQNPLLLMESLLANMYRDADRYIGIERPGRAAQYGRIFETVLGSIAHHLTSATQNSTILSTDSPAYRTVLPLVLEALSAWHLSYTLSFRTAQYSSKKGYNSKKYLFDTGIANFLLSRMQPVQFGTGDSITAMLLENGVLQDIISRVGSVGAVSSYHSNNRVQTELDFVVTGKNTTVPVEVKSASRIKLQTLHQMIDFMERFNVSDGYVVFNGMPETQIVNGKTVHYIPPYMVGQIIAPAMV